MTAPDPATLSQDTIVDFLADILERRGAEAYIGEPVTISQHMLQCAELAEAEDGRDVMVVAALLHDIGHFTSEFAPDAADDGVDNLHEEAGARVIERFFPGLVTDCVRHHVAAKRYLCVTDPDYFAGLSDASVLSLKLQGGPMQGAELDAFAAEPNLDAILQVRRWDDRAKAPGHRAPPLDHFRPALERVARRSG